MAKMILIGIKSHEKEGTDVTYYGYKCVVGADGQVIAEVPADLEELEASHGRATAVVAAKQVKEVPVFAEEHDAVVEDTGAPKVDGRTLRGRKSI